MRIFLDARMFYHSGIGRYALNLYRELLRLVPSPQVTLGVNKQVRRQLIAGAGKSIGFISYNAPIYSLREQLLGSYLSRRYLQQFDLFHFPHYNIPWYCPSNTVVTCHDLIHLLFSEYFTSPRVFLARNVLKRVADRAERIILVSHSSEKDFLNIFPQAKNKTRVIYHGIEQSFRPLSVDIVNDFKKKVGLKEFILYVGNQKPHKNLNRLVKAYLDVKRKYQGLQLVVIGSQKGTNLMTDGLATSGIIEVNKVNDTELVLYYNAATMCCFPSLYEGFGLPPLEAMACGTPVITSNTSSLPEVVGAAAIMIDPYNVGELAEAICRVLDDSTLRNTMKLKGLERAKKFSWEEAARRTLKVYREACKG